jgi:glycosyltransferase involved in cell wall biosynthesis
MRRADADIYYYNLGDMGLGQVAMWCRRHGRKCVYSVASNPDCDPKLPVLRPLRERVLYRYGLRHADQSIVQTRVQQHMLQQGFGRSSIVIPMPCFVPDGPRRPRAADPDGSTRVLWIGRFSPEKRLEWLLDVAAQCPELQFDVIGDANVRTDYAARLVDRATNMRNVALHGRLPWEHVLPFYDNALALCCTSA